MHASHAVRRFLLRLWHADAFLTGVGMLMAGALVIFLAGTALDPRTITGAPAWLKPAKFAASTAIYSFTLAWVFTFLRDWPRVRRVAGWTTGVVFVFEVVIIAAQAWRGTTSHFNLATPLDAALFRVMGAGIITQTLAASLIAITLWRVTFADRALGWALRAGMVLTLAGAGIGGLMTRPTEWQIAGASAGNRLTVAGAHTVGAPDGGPGLPGTGWSREHGDLRVPHFAGLHAVQALAVLAVLLRRRLDDPRRTRLTLALAASYAGWLVILLWQALRGQSILQPDAATLLAFSTWTAVTAAAAWIAVRRRPGSARPAGAQWVRV